MVTFSPPFIKRENWIFLPSFSFFLLLFLSFHGFVFGQVDITAGIDGAKGVENIPLNGTISISHKKSDPIDIGSFRLKGKPFKVELIKEVPVNNDGSYIISIFHFEIPGQEAGLYYLPGISVKVGHQDYQSISSTYEVMSATSKKQSMYPSQNVELASNVELKLEARMDGPVLLYPQQYFSFVYRFYFNGDIELTKEELPLLNGKGFKKIGDKVVKNIQEGNWNVQEIFQKFQAISPGEYSFPASFVEGYAYYEDPILKKKTYIKPKLHAEANPITVNVLAFPERGKPKSFQGAVGQFTVQSTLLTPATVQVGEKMRLAIDIFSRDAFLESVQLPDIHQLPGIKGLFRLSDLPSVGSIKDNTKRFIIEIFPLTNSIKEIPKIEFSYFDPLANQYETIVTNPIPITVISKIDTDRKKEIETPVNVQESSEPKETLNLEPPPPQPEMKIPTAPIEIESIEKDVSEVNEFESFFGTWMLLWIIPFGILAILIQIAILHSLKNRKKMDKTIQSTEIWKEALEQPYPSSQFYNLLNKAFILKLYENKIISQPDINIEEIPNEGMAGEAKTLLLKFQEQRFSNTKPYSDEELLKQSKELFNRL